MPISMRIGAFAIGMLGGVAIVPLPSYAVDDDIEIDTPGAIVEVERDRPGLLTSTSRRQAPTSMSRAMTTTTMTMSRRLRPSSSTTINRQFWSGVSQEPAWRSNVADMRAWPQFSL
jgi:hypothetical protein